MEPEVGIDRHDFADPSLDVVPSAGTTPKARVGNLGHFLDGRRRRVGRLNHLLGRFVVVLAGCAVAAFGGGW